MYCPIDEAWGNTGSSLLDATETKSEKRMVVRKNQPEHFTSEEVDEPNKDKLYQQYVALKQMFGDDEDKKSRVCNAVYSHMDSCQFCKDKYQSNDRCLLPVIDLNDVSKFVKRNNDIVTILLFAFLVLLIIKLLK
jgi:hypothetical protein